MVIGPKRSSIDKVQRAYRAWPQRAYRTQHRHDAPVADALVLASIR